MATAVKRLLSGSTGGDGIMVSGSATATAVTVHTATSSTTQGTYDEIWLWAFNLDSSNVSLTLEYGSSTTNTLIVSIPAQSGLIPILPGLILQNSLTIKAFATTINKVVLVGFVNRMTD